ARSVPSISLSFFCIYLLYLHHLRLYSCYGRESPCTVYPVWVMAHPKVMGNSRRQRPRLSMYARERIRQLLAEGYTSCQVVTALTQEVNCYINCGMVKPSISGRAKCL
ncbi:hypothetical protein GBAR_LOCUS12991, partial [Geodia barretti]